MWRKNLWCLELDGVKKDTEKVKAAGGTPGHECTSYATCVWMWKKAYFSITVRYTAFFINMIKGILWDRQWNPSSMYWDFPPQMLIYLFLQKCISNHDTKESSLFFRANRVLASHPTFKKNIGPILYDWCIHHFIFLHSYCYLYFTQVL